APGWNPGMMAPTTSRIATRASGFTARSSHRGRERAAKAAGESIPRDGATCPRTPAERALDGRCRATGVDHLPGAGGHVGDVELGDVLLGDSDARDLLGAAALAERDGVRAFAHVYDDRVEDRARLDSAPPGRLDDDRRPVVPGRQTLGGDRVHVDRLTRLGDDRLLA